MVIQRHVTANVQDSGPSDNSNSLICKLHYI